MIDSYNKIKNKKDIDKNKEKFILAFIYII